VRTLNVTRDVPGDPPRRGCVVDRLQPHAEDLGAFRRGYQHTGDRSPNRESDSSPTGSSCSLAGPRFRAKLARPPVSYVSSQCDHRHLRPVEGAVTQRYPG
jgi:hypothetical protein